MARKDKSEGSPSKSSNENSSSAQNNAEGATQRSQPQRRFESMVEQLESLGLKLRRVLGDGNCLFRALGDQIEGHTKHHLEFRRRTVAYMREHREFFEPFVDDSTSFDRYVALLDEPGTHAGNDAIVAFAGSHEAVVVVHQLNVPLYHIGPHGRDKNRLPARELHVAYHNGDHYDSIRMFGEVDGIECAAMVHIPTIIRNPSQQAISDHPDSRRTYTGGAFRLRLCCEVKSKTEGLWSPTGSGRRIFGDETADLAMVLPSSSSVAVGRRCDNEGWKDRKEGEQVAEEGAQDDVHAGFNEFDWRNGFTSRCPALRPSRDRNLPKPT